MADSLKYGTSFWESVLSPDQVPTRLEDKLHLVVSLIIFLSLPISRLLLFLFSCELKPVKSRAALFMGYHKSANDPNEVFFPSTIYKLWHERWPKARKHLHSTVVEPCAAEIAVKESDQIIRHKGFHIKLSKLTIASIRELLDPRAVLRVIQEKAPFTYRFLHAFTTAPNEHRRKMAATPSKSADSTSAGQDIPDEEDPVADGLGDHGDGDPGEQWQNVYPGFTRNPILVITMAICMCAFVRNRATNVLALPLGLFFKISGTSERVLTLLSNIGLAVSSTTVERVKERVSQDAVQLAIQLITSSALWFIIFDNINLYLRKFQERITNHHTMIHATNVAVIGIPGDASVVGNLSDMLSLRGKRVSATFADIRPTEEDGAFVAEAFRWLIADVLVRYTPGSAKWPRRAEMLEKIASSMPKDRPLTPEKSDMRPLGVLNVNEGSKKGMIKVLEELQKKSTLGEEDWSSRTRIIQGDWLTSNNIRAARRERVDDVNSMERLEYIREISALFHFSLNALLTIMRTHFGNAITDPTSLAADKGVLRRTWDAHKPNYAAGKSLTRHCFIARALYRAMAIEGIGSWSDLKKWTPSYDDIVRLATEIQTKFTVVSEAHRAQAAGDDWYAHDIYFMRDALLFLLFEHAVSTADAGIVLRVLKYWALAFRGAGQHNYARECAEILVTWKYELTDELRAALEQSWFVNRWGLPGRWIAADLYLEQCNFWVKIFFNHTQRVFIASGSGVTIEYIMAKGSSGVEAYREISHLVAQFFGDDDRARRSKEIAFQEDMRVLVEGMIRRKAHSLGQHFVPEPKPKKPKKGASKARSAIVDVFTIGADIWQNGKFKEWLKATTFDPAIGYPPRGEPASDTNAPRDSRLDSDSAFNGSNENVFEIDNYIDLHGDESSQHSTACGALGGGGEFHTGMEAF